MLSEKEMAHLILLYWDTAKWTNWTELAAAAIASKIREGVVPLRERVEDWYTEKGYNASPQTLMLGLMEEVGELSQAILLTQCEDFKPSRHKLRGEIGDIEKHKDLAAEVGDVLTYLIALCNALDIDPKLKPLDGQSVSIAVTLEE